MLNFAFLKILIKDSTWAEIFANRNWNDVNEWQLFAFIGSDNSQWWPPWPSGKHCKHEEEGRVILFKKSQNTNTVFVTPKHGILYIILEVLLRKV